MTKPLIAVIGPGHVGQVLSRSLAAKGYTILLGTRDVQNDELQAFAIEIGNGAQVALVQDAIDRAEVLLLTLPWNAVQPALTKLKGFAGKILVDVTNPLLPDLSGLALGHSTSGAEQVAQWAPGARVVKAFNTIGTSVMANPSFNGHATPLYYCGDDAPAKAIVHQLAVDVGFQPVDGGHLSFARVLEPTALLWITSAYKLGFGNDFAFHIVKRH